MGSNIKEEQLPIGEKEQVTGDHRYKQIIFSPFFSFLFKCLIFSIRCFDGDALK